MHSSHYLTECAFVFEVSAFLVSCKLFFSFLRHSISRLPHIFKKKIIKNQITKHIDLIYSEITTNIMRNTDSLIVDDVKWLMSL